MKTATWTPAIKIEDPDTHAWRTVNSTRQARSMLQRHWPNPAGSRYRQAETSCDRALHDEAETENARKAFIAAAIEAHLHLG